MMRCGKYVVVALAFAVLLGAAAADAQDSKITFSGNIYTKWLWGNMRYGGSLYNFTTVPGEGYGDNGQGTEFELFYNARVSDQVEVYGRLKARFNQNFWTNYGGFGGSNPPNVPCVGGDCGEFDPRSAQYIKMRGVGVRLTPGYKWLDMATIGSNDWGQFDPYTVGKIRYIDRDNASGLLFQGSFANKTLRYDAARISLPRLWAGPAYNTGIFSQADAAYALQLSYLPGPMWDVTGVAYYVNDIEVDSRDIIVDNGRDIRTRFRNEVGGIRFAVHPDPIVDISGRYYKTVADSVQLGLPGNCMGNPCEPPASFSVYGGFSPVPAGRQSGDLWKLNVDLNDPFAMGLSFNLEYFNIGANYVSMMAARREADILLTEGHDSAYAFPGPSNAKYGIFGGNPTVIGFGGWDGNAQQIATINVDNEFTDFDEPMAETAIGWKGFTVVPVWNTGALQLSGEYTHIGYNTNWDVWGRIDGPVDSSVYPGAELDSGVGHNFRSAYIPFQHKKTDIWLVKGKYLVDVGTGLDLFAKAKFITDKDKRINDVRFLPYAAGDCSGDGEPCANDVNHYYDNFSTSSIYSNPPVITVNGVTGYQWKPFDSIADDDRDLDYKMFQLGAGYQVTNEVYASLSIEHFMADLKDGNTAFQAYNVHELASGKHRQDKWTLLVKYFLAGMEFGLNYQYITGSFKPDFGDGFVVQYATEQIAQDHNVKVGSRGFTGRFGGWNSLEERKFDHQRLKAFMKVSF